MNPLQKLQFNYHKIPIATIPIIIAILLTLPIQIYSQSSTIPALTRLSTYCATHAHCPESSTCGSFSYCECLPDYTSFDRLLNSCLPIANNYHYNDQRFTLLNIYCKERINCPTNSYCDPVGKCNCLPDYITLTGEQCSFYTVRPPWTDQRYRSTRLPCRSTTNCPMNSICKSSECVCDNGYLADGRLAEGFFVGCSEFSTGTKKMFVPIIVILEIFVLLLLF